MSRNITTAAWLLAATLGALALAQQHSSRGGELGPEPARIHIGQPLVEVSKILSARKIYFGEGGWAFAIVDPDQSNLFFQLDENRADVCAYFSKSRARITGLRMVFFPGRTGRNKACESWVPATELLLYPDRSYAVHFATPLTPEELRSVEANRPKPQYPPVPSQPGGRGKR